MVSHIEALQRQFEPASLVVIIKGHGDLCTKTVTLSNWIPQRVSLRGMGLEKAGNSPHTVLPAWMLALLVVITGLARGWFCPG